MGGVEADIFSLEPEPKKKYLKPKPRKMARLRNTGPERRMGCIADYSLKKWVSSFLI